MKYFLVQDHGNHGDPMLYLAVDIEKVRAYLRSLRLTPDNYFIYEIIAKTIS